VPENVAENCVVYAAEGAIHIVGSDAEAIVFNVKSQSSIAVATVWLWFALASTW
jgi:hypothetical protein